MPSTQPYMTPSAKSCLMLMTVTGALLISPLFSSGDFSSPLAPTAAYATENENSQRITSPDGASITGVKVLNRGQSIQVTGTGWVNPQGSGSRISIKADRGQTKLQGQDILRTLDADSAGNFSLTLEFPSTAHGYSTNWEPGSAHTLHFLTGSAQAGDTLRSLTLPLTIADSSSPDQPLDTSGWAELRAEDAVLKIRPYNSGQKLRIVGQNWVNREKKGGSVVALKLASGQDTFFERSDNSAQNAYLRSLGQSELGEDRTIWALLTDDAQAADPSQGIYLINADGSFDLELEIPEELAQAAPGDYLALQALSGRFAPGDTRRSARTEPLPVNGLAHQISPSEEASQCMSEATAPSASILNPLVEAGGRLHLVGTGWCNPGGKGVPRIALKIDEAGISRKDTKLHSNKTIWAIIEPDSRTGAIDTWIQLPAADGSDSEPGLSEGAHSLRMLSGSLQAGDLAMSYGGIGVLDFVVGRYSPTAIPDTLAESDMSDANANGVTVVEVGKRIEVTVPTANPGQWVLINPYLGGSVRSAWGSGWVQLDEKRQVSYLMDEDLAPGTYRFAVQNGEQEGFGGLLGWSEVRVQRPGSSAPHESGQGSTEILPSSPASGEKTRVPAQQVPQGLSRVSKDQARQAPGTTSSLAQAVRKQEKIVQATQRDQDSGKDSKPQSTLQALAASGSAETGASSSEAISRSAPTGNSEKSIWQGFISTNNLLLLAAAGIILGATCLSHKRSTASSDTSKGQS